MNISTKANTLKYLAPLLTKASIENSFSITEKEWNLSKKNILNSIKKQFKGETLIVRSSALNEDCLNQSNAGAFKSVLNVNGNIKKEISRAINEVIKSYKAKNSLNPENQILVQKQTKNVLFSGTILTRNYNGAPYYVLSYSDSEDTACVTSGKNSSSVSILRSTEYKDIPSKFRDLIGAVRELERIFKLIPLDIEFAVKKDKKIVIFQTRPLVINSKIIPNEKEIYKTIRSLRAKFRRLSKQRKHITGSFTYFTDMTDWNPAEMIGSSPNTLAYSLYDYLITRSVWHKAKAGLGYTNVNPAKLVHLFGNKPYVDVRSNFNAFIPSRVPLRLKKKLMCFFMKKLRENPHLQDKVEFEILYTCFDFSIESRFNELLKEGFNLKDIRILKKILVELNNNLLKDDPLETDFKINEEMEKDRERVSCLKNVSAREKINNGLKLLKICKNKGTLQFARITRLAFISNCLLRSLITQKIITQDEYDSFYSSINTVLTDFTKDVSLYFAKKISSKIFLQKYGHLRPGTYDITVSRYDKTPYYFFQNSICYFPNKSRLLINENNENKQKKISILLKKEGIKIDVKNLFKIMKKALQLRENSKFLFTKCLSDALEMIAEGTSELGFSRYEVSFLSLRELKKALTKGDKEMTKYLRNQVEASRKKYQLNSNLSLPPILFSEKDFNIISYYKAEPNYITSQKIGGELFFLEGNLGNKSSYDFSNKLVVIENADPGYDWIFLKNPAGVITKYGGVASHMSIRCAELQIPAAIGCGDVIYNSLKKMNSAILDCNNRRLIELN